LNNTKKEEAPMTSRKLKWTEQVTMRPLEMALAEETRIRYSARAEKSSKYTIDGHYGVSLMDHTKQPSVLYQGQFFDVAVWSKHPGHRRRYLGTYHSLDAAKEAAQDDYALPLFSARLSSRRWPRGIGIGS
jgi:hypothetical protein